MKIDCTKLLNGQIPRLEVTEELEIPKAFLKNTDILSIHHLIAHLQITEKEEFLQITGQVSGKMMLRDSISLEEIEYPFTAEIEENWEENLKNNANILDITEILWQNIMLEVPLKLSHVEDFNEYQGDGWKLVSEDEFQTTNNPFRELKDMMREE